MAHSEPETLHLKPSIQKSSDPVITTMPRKHNKTDISEQTRHEAMTVAKGTQKPGQTKDQTRLIAQGIEKGIAEYKKREKQKARERDKQRKQALKAKETTAETDTEETISKTPANPSNWLPWLLLAASWAGFIAFQIFETAP